MVCDTQISCTRNDGYVRWRELGGMGLEPKPKVTVMELEEICDLGS